MDKAVWKVTAGHTIALCTSECKIATYNSRNNLLVVYGYKTESVFSTNGATTKDVKKFVKKFLSSECDIFKCRNKKFTLVGYERTDVVSREDMKTSAGTWYRRTDGYCWLERDGREVAHYLSPVCFGDDQQGLENELRAREAFEASLKALEDLK